MGTLWDPSPCLSFPWRTQRWTSPVRATSIHEQQAAPGPSGIAGCRGCFPVLGSRRWGIEGKRMEGTCSACSVSLGLKSWSQPLSQHLCLNPIGKLMGNSYRRPLWPCGIHPYSVPVTPWVIWNVFGNGPGELPTAPQRPSEGHPRRASVREGQALETFHECRSGGPKALP